MKRVALTTMVLTTILILIGTMAAAAELHDIRYHLNKGEQFDISVVQQQVIDQKMPDKPVRLQQSVRIDLQAKVRAVDRDDNHTARIKIARVAFRSNNPQMPVDYDSETGNGSDNPLTAFFAALNGQTLTVKTSPTGRLLELDGLDSLIERAFDALGKADPAAKAVLEGVLGDTDMFEQMMAQNTAMYPAKPVSVGDSWTRSFSMAGIMPMKLDTTYTLKSADPDWYMIEEKTTISPTGENEWIEVGDARISIRLQGSQKSDITVQRSNGLARSMKTQQTIVGKTTVLTKDPKNPRVEIPMKIQSRVTVTLTPK